jgi:hypothetical protein
METFSHIEPSAVTPRAQADNLPLPSRAGGHFAIARLTFLEGKERFRGNQAFMPAQGSRISANLASRGIFSYHFSNFRNAAQNCQDKKAL